MNRKQIDTIESHVTIPDVLALHGARPTRARCKCPIHNGQRDSFSFTDKVYHCFTCGASGGVIQLEASLDGTDLDTACHTLAKQFGLNIDAPLTRQEREAFRIERKVEQSYAEWKAEQDEYYRHVSNLYRHLLGEPKLSDVAQSAEQWLDENIGGVTQPWIYLSSQQKTI